MKVELVIINFDVMVDVFGFGFDFLDDDIGEVDLLLLEIFW